MERTIADRNYRFFIILLSALIPAVVGILMFAPIKTAVTGHWTYLLPHLNAALNGATTVLLITGFILIRRGNREGHKKAMSAAFVLGTVFLASYLIYHSSAPSTIYGDADGNGILENVEKTAVDTTRMIYLGILLSHILLAVAVVPLVLSALFFALRKSFARHRKIARFAYPVWLYVSLSGVIVYLMIRPFY